MNSECGNVWGYTGSTGDCDFTWDYRLMINAFRRRLKCAGWLYTEHHDVINEWNGYVRFDRSPKYDGMDELAGMSIADLHKKAVVVFYGTPGSETGLVLPKGEKYTIPVGVSLVTDKYSGRTLTMSSSAWWYDQNGVRIFMPEKMIDGKFPAKSWQAEKLWDYDFMSPTTPACGVVLFKLYADGKEIARNFWTFSTVDSASTMVKPVDSRWSDGTAEVLDGLKINGFGKGYFEYELPAPEKGGVFRAELSAKRKNGKDRKGDGLKSNLSLMLGGGSFDRSNSPNSYPQTSDEKYPADIKVYVDGALAAEMRLADDPADHRGILSWFAQPRTRKLYEAGSYGYLVEVPVAASAVKNGKVKIRIESNKGLTVYGPRFGRYPLSPAVFEK